MAIGSLLSDFSLQVMLDGLGIDFKRPGFEPAEALLKALLFCFMRCVPALLMELAHSPR